MEEYSLKDHHGVIQSRVTLKRRLKNLETAMKMAAAAETITLTSQDHREGVQAFREKRTPTYEGK